MLSFELNLPQSEIADPLTAEIHRWNHEEAKSSMAADSINGYLDKLEDARAWIAMEYDDPRNYIGAKHNSHRLRQFTWGKYLAEEPANDYLLAQQLFNVQMRISGTYRLMCYIAAVDQADYEARRKTPGTIGIDTRAVVIGRVAAYRVLTSDGMRMIAPDPEEYNRSILLTFDQTADDFYRLRARVPEDFGKTDSPSLNILRDTQTEWVARLTNGILMAIGLREGAIEDVPFLEPKGISDNPQVYYPFRAAS